MSRASNPLEELLEERAAFLVDVRAFFSHRSFLEVDLPLLIPKAQIDAYIHPMETSSGFLHTSPEYAMKKVLSQVPRDIYQIAHVFRKGESGRYHTPEFLMVEWYRIGFGYQALIDETLALLQHLLGPLEVRYARFQDLWRYVPQDDLRTKEELFDAFVVPELRKQEICVITDYPPEAASLARVEEGTAQRFEIYMRGLELANGFVECSCSKTLRGRLEEQNALRTAAGNPAYEIDEEFLQASEQLPPCAGVSVGLDRVFLRKKSATHIDEISPLRLVTQSLAQ
ncbi:MAG: amino acid--tRNA ligase-related protein [Chlamydiota bacterium]